jgi:hypothetical protein
VFNQLRALLKFAANGDHLSNVVVCRKFHGTDITLDKVVQKIL